MNKISLLLITLVMCATAHADLDVASFNIKWIGYSSDRENEKLSNMLSQYDIVFVQELVSPPYDGTYPSGNPYRPDEESKAFFEAMIKQGFKYVLSESDTGSGDSVESNSASTEWFVVFYKPNEANVDNSYFIESDLSNNQYFKRVPYNFVVTDKDNKKQYNFVSVHLNPGNGLDDREYRKNEIFKLKKWAMLQNTATIILGDMNIYDCERLEEWVQPILKIGDKECEGTNLKQNKPYDQVLYRGVTIDDVHVLNLYNYFNINPDTFDYREMTKYYSDHHPIYFQLN